MAYYSSVKESTDTKYNTGKNMTVRPSQTKRSSEILVTRRISAVSWAGVRDMGDCEGVRGNILKGMKCPVVLTVVVMGLQKWTCLSKLIEL